MDPLGVWGARERASPSDILLWKISEQLFFFRACHPGIGALQQVTSLSVVWRLFLHNECVAHQHQTLFRQKTPVCFMHGRFLGKKAVFAQIEPTRQSVCLCSENANVHEMKGLSASGGRSVCFACSSGHLLRTPCA